MCLILTLIVSLISSICYAAKLLYKKVADKSLISVTMMYWSAALMFAFVGIADKLAGKAFLEITIKDTVIGAIVVIAGILMYFFLKSKNKQ